MGFAEEQTKALSAKLNGKHVTRAPRWRVVSGQFTVAWDGGLLSEVRTGAEVRTDTRRTGSTGQGSMSDLVEDLLKGVLEEPSDKRRGSESGTSDPAKNGGVIIPH